MDNKEIIKELEEAIVLNREARTKNNDAMCHAKNALASNRDGYSYEQGLEEAWEIARKIIVPSSSGGLDGEALHKIFGESYYTAITPLVKFSIHEVKEKIAAWEKDQEEKAKPKLGDVVEVHDNKFGGISRGILVGENPDLWVLLMKGYDVPQHLCKHDSSIKKLNKYVDVCCVLDEIG